MAAITNSEKGTRMIIHTIKRNEDEDVDMDGTEEKKCPCPGCQPNCNYCGKRDVTPACGKCGVTYYCSKECQKADWAFHKQVCDMYAMHKGIPKLDYAESIEKGRDCIIRAKLARRILDQIEELSASDQFGANFSPCTSLEVVGVLVLVWGKLHGGVPEHDQHIPAEILDMFKANQDRDFKNKVPRRLPHRHSWLHGRLDEEVY